MNGNDELDRADLAFLRAIRALDRSPERYASTEQGVTPVTVTTISESTSLPEAEVASLLDHSRLDESDPVNVDGAGTAGDARASLDSADHTAAGERAPAAGDRDVGDDSDADRRESAVDEDDDRLAALEARVEQLEAEQRETTSVVDERVDELIARLDDLERTTARLTSTVDDALSTLDAIEESEYGALDEKRERQFETAVKSMVAFHQLATEVLDVRVENYEPSAGRAEPERVETSRNRIVDALGVGERDGVSLGSDDDWPDPEEAVERGRVFSGDDDSELEQESDALEQESDALEQESDALEQESDALEQESDAPEQESDAPEQESDAPEQESDAPESGVYPPIGGSRNDDPDGEADVSNADGSLPESMRPETEETAASSLETDVWRLTGVDVEQLLTVSEAIVAERQAADDPFPAGEAYARIVGDPVAGEAYARVVEESAPGGARDDDGR